MLRRLPNPGGTAHRRVRRSIRLLPAPFALILVATCQGAGEFDDFLKPLLTENCVKCHGGQKIKGKVNFKEIATAEQFGAKPDLIKDMIEAVEAYDMPPEDEPELDPENRSRLLATLKTMLRESASGDDARPVQIRRLNRFQYNNSIKDLFQLDRDVFALPEKLMTRRDDYLTSQSAVMPETVRVECLSLRPEGGMDGVGAFPKDLRAAHGFDNQANQLTLSPLLLDAFLKLSVSILESPDFNEKTVGIWDRFFREPAAGADLDKEVRTRLEPFLTQAFRSAIDGETLDRYAAYALAKRTQGLSYTDSMKKTASAVLSSPRFLYRHGSTDDEDDLFVLASNLSYVLWSSIPDRELLELAARRELLKPGVLAATIERMLADPKIERFLDSFPSQWMQLENILAATPDPGLARLFSLDPDHTASLQMVLEPLLLFDAVFIEDRPIVELIAPAFSYRSDFLHDWYTSDLKRPELNRDRLVDENRAKDEQRRALRATIASTQAELEALLTPVRSALLEERRKNPGTRKPVDLKPYAAWEFNRDLKDSIGSLHLNPHGEIRYEDGMVVLEKSYLQSESLPIDLKAKSLEVWCKVHDLNQSGGGVMGIQGPGDFFDTIVLGERKPQHWISGSNGFSRTEDFPNSTPESQPGELLHLVMVYRKDGTTTLYRNGEPYGKPYRKDAATFPRDQSSVLFGLRHLPAEGNRFLSVSLAKARLYDRALSEEEVAATANGAGYTSAEELRQALTPDQREQQEALGKTLAQAEEALRKVPPNQDPDRAQEELARRFDDELRRKIRSPVFKRVAASDPRYGGVITNAAMLSMTSGPTRTQPIARGAWMIEVIFNDPPPPPPNNVPPLNEDDSATDLTIREKFAQHRENPDCAGCHAKLDPLGFALENYDIIGRWRDTYDNGRAVDATGTLMRKYEFDGIVRFKEALVSERKRFARAFTAHLLRFALARELEAADSLTIDAIISKTETGGFRLKSLLREVIQSDAFLQPN